MSSKFKTKQKENSSRSLSTNDSTQTKHTVTTTKNEITTVTRTSSSYSICQSSCSVSTYRASLPKSAFLQPTHDYNTGTKSGFKNGFSGLQKSIEYTPQTDVKVFVPPTTSPSTSQMNQIIPTSSNVNELKFNLNEPKIVSNNELNEKLKIEVKATGNYLGKDSKLPCYDTTSSKNRGKLLLINNIKFKDPNKKRDGAEVDQANLVAVFKQIGFDILEYSNKTRSQIKSIVKDFASNSSLKKYDICVTVIMSHGRTSNDQTMIESVNGKELPTEWVVEQFHGDCCKGLIGKPKIFIFQCCRGEKPNVVIHTDTNVPPPIRTVQDILISYSTLPGFVAYRGTTSGSWYIQELCKVFMEHAHNTHVEDLLKIVNNELSKINISPEYGQISSYENRGFKICYLNPIKLGINN